MKNNNPLLIGLILACGLILSGCSLTRLPTKRRKIEEKAMESARQNNTLGNRALERQPVDKRTIQTEVARQATEQNEKILGTPIREIPVASILQTNSTNYDGWRDDAERNLGKTFERQDDTEARRREYSRQMEEQGRLKIEKDKERYRLWRSRIIKGLVVLGIIAAIIAALVYGGPIISSIFAAFTALRALRSHVVGTQKFFEASHPAHGALLAEYLGAEMANKPEEKDLIRSIKADAYKKREIETVSVPETPPGDKPPVRTPDVVGGPESTGHPIGRPVGGPVP